MPTSLRANVARVLIDEESLGQKVAELAAMIERDYGPEDELMLICILKGSYIFLADLCRHLDIPHEVDFMGVSSYGADTRSSGAVQIIMDLKGDISNRHVLIVEDIIDSGRTLDYLRRNLLARSPASLRIMALLNKPARREVEVAVDYIGFDIPDEFVVGYGLDFDQLYRNLPYIGVLKPEVIDLKHET